MSRLATAVLAVTLTLGTTAASAQSDPAPCETVRTLTALQDQIADGDSVAQAAHAKAILRAGRAFVKAKPAVWADRRNARALVVYLFSGGDARTMAATVAATQIAPGLEDLYAGAIAYGIGDDDTARAKLMAIDPKTQPSGLGGHLALVQATLVTHQDQAKAIALLDLARLLEPGTLVEEAALRKEMSLIGATGDLAKFALLTRRYLGVFEHSFYAENFRELVARTAMDVGADDTAEAGAKLARLMTGLGQAERRRLYLAIAHVAVVAGRTTMAALAGEEARKLSRPDDTEAARAMVYYGAAAIIGTDYELGKTALAGAAAERLDASDRALRTSALGIAETIRQPLAAAQSTSMQTQDASVSADAERSLAAADTVLKAATP